jgi:phosphomannomutase
MTAVPQRLIFCCCAAAFLAITTTEAWIPYSYQFARSAVSVRLLPISSTTTTTTSTGGSKQHSFPAFRDAVFAPDACDNVNTPPSLSILTRSLQALTNTGNTDVRGKFVDHAPRGSLASVTHEIARVSSSSSSDTNKGSSAALLTPFAAYCLGQALGQFLHSQEATTQHKDNASKSADPEGLPTIQTVVIGVDPRPHSVKLAAAFSCGLESVPNTKMLYTQLASTPSMAWMARMNKADATVMVTASHLPVDKNGFKFFLSQQGGMTVKQVKQLGQLATQCATVWYEHGVLPPTMSSNHVSCQWVDLFPEYAATLNSAVQRETKDHQLSYATQPLQGLKIVLNAGNGSGGFFAKVLQDLGADISHSLNVEPDGTFPAGVPNPEDKKMVQRTLEQCVAVQADLGIMLDTDADRCGFIVPSLDGSGYEALNRNRLIALLGVAFSRQSPGCAIVTDSVTSEGLAKFLVEDLDLIHVRYLKGYANVINKAKELTESGKANAEVAIETSGHCAMQENGYLDDGTYTAVKVVSMLALESKSSESKSPLLKLIEALQEMPVVDEVRLPIHDGSLETMKATFDICATEIERKATANEYGWELDRENLEGVRVRFGQDQFFMLRKSLHDPIISLQVEALSPASASEHVVAPLIALFESNGPINDVLSLEALKKYL